ncbi:ATP-binding protein [Microlunatus ginsengisoli]|uniref:Uridine kinase n=1 Tax=Microlunatus ginsengisoli TaxID=363863 RepID=A0ABP7A9W4_9ACTN
MAQVVLLAGPSGSGKSRVARLSGCPQLALDDFYYDGDHPGLPHALGIVDWDDPGSWDADAAMAAIVALCESGRAEVPTYDISTSRRTGSRRLELDGAPCFVAEGLFAPDVVARCRAAGVLGEALYLDRPRTLTLLLRFVRDVREHRKPLGVLIRRGLALWRAEPQVRADALAAGCRPVSLREALRIVAARMQTSSS